MFITCVATEYIWTVISSIFSLLSLCCRTQGHNEPSMSSVNFPLALQKAFFLVLCKVPASPQKPCVSTFKATAFCATVSGFATWLNRKFMQSYQRLAWFSQTVCVGKLHTFWEQGGCVCLDYFNIITVIPARAVKDRNLLRPSVWLYQQKKKKSQHKNSKQMPQSKHIHSEVPSFIFILAWWKSCILKMRYIQ